MVMTPKIRLSRSACCSSSRPSPPNAVPKATNTAVKPSTNSTAPSTIRVRGETAVRTAVVVLPAPSTSDGAPPVPTSPAT
jgi:hypothetical protein